MSFLKELKRRKVIRVGIAYLIGAWLLLQLTEVLSELLNLPENVGPIVVAIVAVGFPIVIVLAWMFELTASGLKRDSAVSDAERSSGKLINAAVLGMLVIALAYFVWESRFQVGPGSDTADAMVQGMPSPTGLSSGEAPGFGRSIAVLPFESFTTDPGDEAFANGLTDTILHQLAQIEELKVIARNSTFQFKGGNRDVREIGEILDVETVLEGSVQRSGERIRVIAQLVRTSDGAHIWSESFDESMDNIFDLQDRITSDIIATFQIRLSAAEQNRLLQAGTDNPEAYRLVIEALGVEFDLDELTVATPEDVLELQLLQQAVALDPSYALAWAYLSRAWNTLAYATDSPVAETQFIAEALRAAETALELDDSLAMSQSARGWAAHRKGETLEAARFFRRALEIEPNHLSSISGLALQLDRSDPAEALRLLERSHELDPTSILVYRQKNFALRALGREDEAIEQLKLGIEADPGFGPFYSDLTNILNRRGRPDEAARLNSKLLVQNPLAQDGQLAMASAWLAATETDRAAEWIDLVLSQRPDSARALNRRVDILFSIGEYDKALEALELIPSTEIGRFYTGLNHAVICFAQRQFECTKQQLDLSLVNLADAKARGYATTDFEIYPTMIDLLLRETQGANHIAGLDPDSGPANAAESALDRLNQSNRFFGHAFMARAGLTARLGKPDEGMTILWEAVESPDGAAFNYDMFGMGAEASMFLNPLRDHPEFASWLATHIERREAMRERMQTMERNGEIMPVIQAERLLGS